MIQHPTGNLPAKIENYVAQKRLRDAFGLLRHYSASLGDWRITDRIDHLEQSYSMMLRYAVDGVDDPSRDEIYHSIVRGIFEILDRVNRELSRQKSPAIYFSTLRYEDLQRDTLKGLADSYLSALSKLSLYNIAAGNSTAVADVKEKEELERRIFNRIWVTHPLSPDDVTIVSAMLSGEEVPAYFKDMIVSALLLGLLQYYDESRLNILLDTYQSAKTRVIAIRALCAALMAMYVNRSRISGSRLEKRIAALRDTTSWHSDVKEVFLEFIRTRDTERINRKMQEELLPSMLKLRPDIAKRMKGSAVDMSDMEENPEWQELLDKSGITDKLKELTKMQEDGGDVFMMTFSNLKYFPFFSEVANWFMPFHIDHSSVKDALGGELSTIGDMVASSPFFCDGDKYSFVLALASVPAAQKRMMLSQFDAQRINELELQRATLSGGEVSAGQIANKYVQNIYRFFKLYRRKGDFIDPFSRPINLLQLPFVAPDLTDVETLPVVSEFYFKRGYYEDAAHVFGMLADVVPPDAQIYQKLGYCRAKLGDTAGALDYYKQAELLNGESLWTLRRIANCYKELDNPEMALEYYRRVEAKKPDDLGVALSIGHCYLELDRYDDALRYYFKVEFLDDKSTRAWRPIAWTSFVAGDFDQSRSYYEKVLTDHPSASDYLNMGHLYLAAGNIKEALNYYGLSVDNESEGTEGFIRSFKSDVPRLVSAGVSESLLPLIIDALLYSRD